MDFLYKKINSIKLSLRLGGLIILIKRFLGARNCGEKRYQQIFVFFTFCNTSCRCIRSVTRFVTRLVDAFVMFCNTFCNKNIGGYMEFVSSYTLTRLHPIIKIGLSLHLYALSSPKKESLPIALIPLISLTSSRCICSGNPVTFLSPHVEIL